VRFKRHGDGGSSNRFGLFDDFMKQSLMANVNPIEISKGDDGIDKRLLNVFETIKYFHFHGCGFTLNVGRLRAITALTCLVKKDI
jgi:hypothetical protein